jgi:hypothetical protein
MTRRAGLSKSQARQLLRKVGVTRGVQGALPGQSKYGAKWTYFDGQTLHTTGTDCVAPVVCPICSTRKPSMARLWYPSRAEALCAQRLVARFLRGEIGSWRRSTSIVLLDAPARRDRITYKPDFDVWMPLTGDAIPAEGRPPDYRIEVKGSSRAMSRDAALRIRMYRALARDGQQPPLVVQDRDGREIDV